MNETLSNHLAEWVDLTKVGILKGLEIVQEQAPDIINQLLLWKIYESSLYIVLGFLFLIITGILCNELGCKVLKKNSCCYNDKGLGGTLITFAVISGFVGCSMGIYSIFQLIFVLVAPKIYLIEYFKTLMI